RRHRQLQCRPLVRHGCRHDHRVLRGHDFRAWLVNESRTGEVKKSPHRPAPVLCRAVVKVFMSMLIFLLTRPSRSLQCERAHIRMKFARRVTAETKAETRQRILDAAQQLFAAGGFATSTTRDIANRAGISTGTLFNYFPSKEFVLAALAAEAVAGVEQDYD